MVLRINGLGHGPLADRRLLGEQRRQRDEPTGDGAPRQEQDRVETRHGQSEQMRAEFAAINRAIREAEDALALIVVARDGLRAVTGHLEHMAEGLGPWRGAPAGAGAEQPPGGTPPPELAATLAATLAESLAAIEEVARSTRFGTRRLLDGSLGCLGRATGDGLEFAGAGPATRSSPPQGYEVVLTAEPMRATLLGERTLTPALVAGGVHLLLREGEASARITTRAGQSAAEVAAALQAEAVRAGLELMVEATADGRLLVQHRRFGAAYRFAAVSSEPGVLSTTQGGARIVANGRDAAGTLNGEPADGLGETLTGCGGNTTTDGLSVRYTGLPFTGVTGRLPHRRISVLEQRVFVGRVVVAQQALPLRLGSAPGEVIWLRLDPVHPGDLAQGVPNAGGFASLAEVRAGTPPEVRDAARLVAAAQAEVAGQMRRLAELAGGPLTDLLTRLRVQAQNLAAATQDLVAPGAAVLAVQELSRHIVQEARAALSAQAHPPTGAMLELLDDAGESPRGGPSSWN